MKELPLKYGCNPHQTPARIFVEQGELPLEVLNGQPGYINFLDALNAWQLVRELKDALHLPAAASFKHVSPAGAALGLPLTAVDQRACGVEDIVGLNDSPLACAYARARSADRMSSFGDFIALSDVCDAATATIIQREVSDGVIAPGYTPRALELLKSKRNGGYSILRMEENYEPAPMERKQVFGITFEQPRNHAKIDATLLGHAVTARKELGNDAKRDLLLALITLKYTQSNSVCYAYEGQTIGVGAGQQSRIHCTRLAGDKADIWWLRRHQRTLSLPFLSTIKRPDRDNLIDSYVAGRDNEAFAKDWQRFFSERPVPLTKDERAAHLAQRKGVALASDAFFPFSDNIERAAQSGVTYVAQPGGSIRDEAVIEACDTYGMTMLFTGLRLFHH
ncbi:MAG: phosphoribosylaminoimidazolecarboxamide formyltransferase [Clostridia bacterium]|nr:phosphoribosylaminoimidazolecarboxamide formyltransferase [Candidatus Pelethousia sp.]NCB31194.1 phosphoribosylaminoimidazolecarboxamide formyltransferase [Clostridia bacterium]